MRTAICTISTNSHLFKTEALFHSLNQHSDADFYCLVTDDMPASTETASVTFLEPNTFSGEIAKQIKKKYKGDELRWACKPLLLLKLLEKGYEKVIYVDNDIFFFSSLDFMFDSLSENAVLLTPHYYLADPNKEQFWLEASFRIGLYNAGFIGVNSQGKTALEWWAKCCAYNVKKAAWRGLFDDQRFLDLMPILFEKVHVLKHAGCNVANWNIDLKKRSLNENGQLVFNEKWPLVFIHFTKGTLRAAQKNEDKLLVPYFEEYVSVLKRFNPTFELSYLTKYSFRETLNYARHLIWLAVRKFES